MSTRLWKTFKELSSIYSPSHGERELCDVLSQKLKSLGVTYREDQANDQIKGNCGNLFGYLSGNITGCPLLFSAHLDTVEPAKGKCAVLCEDGTILSKGNTILGADDVAGITVIIEAITRIREQNLPHRSIELLFPVAEEKYGAGSAVFDYNHIKSKEAYVLDLSGAIGEAANAAPTILSFEIMVRGKASHAGFAPENGIHAIMVTAKAIAQLPQGKPAPELTFNIGQIMGGKSTNIVPDECTVNGEIRGLDHMQVLSYWEKVKAIFNCEAQTAGAEMKATHEIKIKAYETTINSSVAQRFMQVCKNSKVPCRIHSTFGGSDQNNFALHGIDGLVIACGMHEVHSTREYSHLKELEDCVRLVMELMTYREEYPK